MTTQVSRKAEGLPVNVEKRLLSYALVAGAGIVAGSQPANAAIVYVDIPDLVIGPTSSGYLFIGSGLATFTFANTTFTNAGFFYAQAGVGGWQAGDSIAMSSFGSYAFNFYTSFYVGGSWGFSSFAMLGYFWDPNLYSAGFGGGGFLGFKFADGLDTYYGWIRLSVDFTYGVGFTTTIYDYAYSTDPGRAIHVFLIPEPGTLGLLALGATGLVLSRLRKRQG